MKRNGIEFRCCLYVVNFTKALFDCVVQSVFVICKPPAFNSKRDHCINLQPTRSNLKLHVMIAFAFLSPYICSTMWRTYFVARRSYEVICTFVPATLQQKYRWWGAHLGSSLAGKGLTGPGLSMLSRATWRRENRTILTFIQLLRLFCCSQAVTWPLSKILISKISHISASGMAPDLSSINGRLDTSPHLQS